MYGARGRGQCRARRFALGVAHCTAQKVMAQMVIAALLLLTAHVAVCQNEVRVVWSVEGVRQYQG